jgi:hypothetical protein
MEWHDPPEDALDEWRAAERRAYSAQVAPPCPSGDAGTLRYVFVRYSDPPQARGGFWIWCPVCRSYEHGSTRVPDWWRDVEVPKDQLMHDPAWLDAHWDDEWLRSQPLRP